MHRETVTRQAEPAVRGDPIGRAPDGACVYRYEDRESAPVGAWVLLPYPDLRGQPVAQVRLLNADALYLPELTEDGRLQPEKRSYVDSYVARLRAGERPPLIDVVEMEDGRMRVVDGHRRVMAVRAAGPLAAARALVSPLISCGDGLVPMTLELMASSTPAESPAAMATRSRARP